MDNQQLELLRRFARDEPMFNAVETAIRTYFLRPSGTDVHVLAAEKILLNKLPAVFSWIRQTATEAKEGAKREQVGL